MFKVQDATFIYTLPQKKPRPLAVGVVVASFVANERSYSTLSPVSSGMSNRFRTGRPQYVTKPAKSPADNHLPGKQAKTIDCDGSSVCLSVRLLPLLSFETTDL